MAKAIISNDVGSGTAVVVTVTLSMKLVPSTVLTPAKVSAASLLAVNQAW